MKENLGLKISWGNVVNIFRFEEEIFAATNVHWESKYYTYFYDKADVIFDNGWEHRMNAYGDKLLDNYECTVDNLGGEIHTTRVNDDEVFYTIITQVFEAWEF